MSKNLDQPVMISITAGTVFKTILIGLFIYFLFVIKDIVLILLTAIVLASAVEPAAQFGSKFKVPRVLSILIVYIIFLTIFIGVFYSFVPILTDDVNKIVNSLPSYVQSLSNSTPVQNIPALNNFFVDISNKVTSPDLIGQIGGTVSGATVGFLNAASSIFGGILSFLLILVLSFYLSVQKDGVAHFLRIIVPVKHEKYTVSLWQRTQKKIGLWMQGQLVLGLLVGVLTYIWLAVWQVEHALFLALIAALFELIPVFGPLIAAIPAVILSLIDGGLTLGLIVLAGYIIIQQFESQLIHPLVVKKIVGIPAILAILALIIGAQIAGFLGILLSVPVTAAIMEYLGDVEKRKMKEEKVFEEEELKKTDKKKA